MEFNNNICKNKYLKEVLKKRLESDKKSKML